MEEKKKIDRLFQEKFKDFEVFPDPVVWKNIENQIKKKKRRILPLWLRLGGVAAILALLVLTGIQFFSETEPGTPVEQQIITDTDKQDDLKLDQNLDQDQELESRRNPVPKALDKTEDTFISSSNKTSAPNKVNDDLTKVAQISHQKKATEQNKNAEANMVLMPGFKESLLPEENKETIALSDPIKEVDTKTDLLKTGQEINDLKNSEEAQIALEPNKEIKEPGKLDIQNELEKDNSKVEESEKTREDRWSLGTNLAPVFYNTLNGGSPIDASLAQNNKTADGNLSYGIKLNYEISDRFSLQSGLNAVELGYSTENVTALLSSSLLDNTSSNLTTNVEGVSIAAVAALPMQSSESFSQRSSGVNLSGNLNQSLHYLEIPMEAKYKLINKKVGVNLIGGFSTYLLYKNQVAISSPDNEITLGEATNLNPVNFSGNLGLDFDYKLSKKLYINVSPMFKYQFNTFSENSGGFEPYYLGVYTGLNFRF